MSKLMLGLVLAHFTRFANLMEGREKWRITRIRNQVIRNPGKD